MKFLLVLLVIFLLPQKFLEAFDTELEGRVKLGSSYIPDSPVGFKDFDSDAELKLGVSGNAWNDGNWHVDYQLELEALQVDGPSEQASLRRETDIDFHHSWLRLDNGKLKFRGGRQNILFGSGYLFRPLGFFDTRNVTGVIPETNGVDGVRSTYSYGNTSLVEGWIVPAKLNKRMVTGLRWETMINEHESGLVAQYHPETDLGDLSQFEQELIQLGYYLKGEYHIGYWNEARLDLEHSKGKNPIRFDAVFGFDYTFDVGDGLHFLLEYFISTHEPQYTQDDTKGNRTIHQFGLLLDQPIGADILWKLFGLFDVRDGSFQIIPQIEYTLTSKTFLYLSGSWGGTLKTDRIDGRFFKETGIFNGTEPNIGLTVVTYF